MRLAEFSGPRNIFLRVFQILFLSIIVFPNIFVSLIYLYNYKFTFYSSYVFIMFQIKCMKIWLNHWTTRILRSVGEFFMKFSIQSMIVWKWRGNLDAFSNFTCRQFWLWDSITFTKYYICSLLKRCVLNRLKLVQLCVSSRRKFSAESFNFTFSSSMHFHALLSGILHFNFVLSLWIFQQTIEWSNCENLENLHGPEIACQKEWTGRGHA